MKYIQFYKVDLAGNTSELLGSDGVMTLDGRWGIPRADSEAIFRAQMLNKHLLKNITGYEIRQGSSFSNSKVVQPYRKMTL